MSSLPHKRATINRLARASFPFFLQLVYDTLESTEPLTWNWHIDAMCHALAEVRSGQDLRLVITIPPRHLKSITISVAFVAWTMGHDPAQKFICASYGSELSHRLSRDFRRVVESDWYKTAFPEFKLGRTTDADIWTTKGGYRTCTSAGGAVTGNGAHYIIVDDISKASDASSPAALEAAREFYKGSLISRLNNFLTGRIIVVAQRIHEDDLPGYCIESRMFRHLNLPAIAQRDEQITLGAGRMKERKIGDLLFPQRFPQSVLDSYARELGKRHYSAQILQDPTPLDSDFFTWSKVQRYLERPERHELQMVVQSWDTAEADSTHADYSVCTTWGWLRGKWLLLHVLRFRAKFHDLVARARAHREQWRPELILIEEAGSGRHLLEAFQIELRTAPQKDLWGWRIDGRRPATSKIDRWAAHAGRLEDGSAILPAAADWLEDLRFELTGFPLRRHDDQVDSISQFLQWSVRGRSAITLMREHLRGPDERPRRRYVDPRELEDDASYWLKRLR